MNWFAKIAERRRNAVKAKADAEAERREAIFRNARREIFWDHRAAREYDGRYATELRDRWIEFCNDRYHFIPARSNVARGFVVQRGYGTWEAYSDNREEMRLIYSGTDKPLAMLRVEKDFAQ